MMFIIFFGERKGVAFHRVQAGAKCFSAASHKLFDSAGSSTARASSKAPTMVESVTSACSWAPGRPQSGDWRATRSIMALMCRVVARRTSGAWRGVSDPSAASGHPCSAFATCSGER